MASYPYTSF
uniref:Uncharacterized protein n=1 Tax=Arundo donax TaxID=35708 RepID=A0A0A8Z334_ARUDO